MDGEIVKPARESLVSSLYGPGTTIGWLLTVASVFATWTLNPYYRRRDTITSDFVAALAFPSVASIHLMNMVANFPGTGSDLFTSADPATVCIAAAIEAPLTICASFMTLSVGLFAVAGLARHHRRASCVFIVGLLAFLSDVVLYVLSFGIETGESNLSRPFLFNLPWAMFVVVLFLVVGLMVYVISLELVPGVPSSFVRVSDYMNRLYSRIRQLCRQGAARLSLYSLVSIPATMVFSAGIGAGLFERTQYQRETTPVKRLLYFIPQSSASFKDLDQAMAVGAGARTLSSVSTKPLRRMQS